MFGSRLRPKKFDYVPRYYKPEDEEDGKKKKRIEFRRMQTKKSGFSLTKLLFLVAIILFFLYYLNKYTQ